MPEWMQIFSQLLPSTQGINLFVQLNQMGVSTQLILPKLIYLICISLILIILSWYRLGVLIKNTHK